MSNIGFGIGSLLQDGYQAALSNYNNIYSQMATQQQQQICQQIPAILKAPSMVEAEEFQWLRRRVQEILWFP